MRAMIRKDVFMRWQESYQVNFKVNLVLMFGLTSFFGVEMNNVLYKKCNMTIHVRSLVGRSVEVCLFTVYLGREVTLVCSFYRTRLLFILYIQLFGLHFIF